MSRPVKGPHQSREAEETLSGIHEQIFLERHVKCATRCPFWVLCLVRPSRAACGASALVFSTS